jgi:hypothetical protein
MSYEFVGPERETVDGSRWRTVKIGDALYQVGVMRGSTRIRIAYKPRGQNMGYHWYGIVRDAKGKTLYDVRVGKGAGLLGILHDAGLVPLPLTPKRRAALEALRDGKLVAGRLPSVLVRMGLLRTATREEFEQRRKWFRLTEAGRAVLGLTADGGANERNEG